MARFAELRLPAPSRSTQESNKAAWNEERSRDNADFFTVGYSGRNLCDFIDILIDAGISSLIDVRQNPVSMYKPDFSKGNLRQALNNAGIEYLHLPELGVPRDVRGLAIESGTRDPIWEWYDGNIIDRFAGRNLHEFFNMADHPVAFMCTELDPTACHRHRITVALERHGLRGFDL